MKAGLVFRWSPLLLLLGACSGGKAARPDGDESGGQGGDVAATGGAPASGGSSSGGTTATGGAGTGGSPWAESPGGVAGAPPETWTEHWFEHDRVMKLFAYDDWVVIYVDDEVDREQLDWMMPFFKDMWRYTVTHYGQFTDGTRDGRVYMLFHQDKYSGGHPSTYFDASHDYRNVSDVGPGPHALGSYGIPVHEVSHIVELASRGVHNSPAFGIWGDSKWAEFYTYDLYMGLGMTTEAEQVYDDFIAKSDVFPEGHTTFWFRDWFYPLWRDHGGVEVMVEYFSLLAEHFPKNGNDFARGLNVGEYVHFSSGAAHANLKAQATTAFGWSEAREAEFVQAQADFPGFTY